MTEVLIPDASQFSDVADFPGQARVVEERVALVALQEVCV